MPEVLLARCGYRCDLCLAYKGNIEKNDRRRELSDGWKKCFGFTIPAEKIYCEGCLASGAPRLIDTACPVRPCVLSRGIENCSECEQYPCEKFNKRQVIYEETAREKQLSASDRALFIQPYENRVRLDELKAKRLGK